MKKLELKIKELRGSIYSKEGERNNKLFSAKTFIQNKTLEILKSDLGRQKEFYNARKVELDFNKNTFLLDGQNNFSESSNVK